MAQLHSYIRVNYGRGRHGTVHTCTCHERTTSSGTRPSQITYPCLRIIRQRGSEFGLQELLQASQDVYIWRALRGAVTAVCSDRARCQMKGRSITGAPVLLRVQTKFAPR